MGVSITVGEEGLILNSTGSMLPASRPASAAVLEDSSPGHAMLSVDTELTQHQIIVAPQHNNSGLITAGDSANDEGEVQSDMISSVKGNKYYATIRKDKVVHKLGHWNTLELAACAYDAKAIEYHMEDTIQNFLHCHEYVMFLVRENIRICTRAKEKENLQGEQQLFYPLVMEHARDDKLVETNKMMFLQYAAGKSTEEDHIDWDKLAAVEDEEEVQVLQRRPVQCTLMKMLTAQCFNCIVTNESNRAYFGCLCWTALATSYEKQARERAMFYLDYDHDKIMVYYRPAGNDDDSLTLGHDPEAARRNVESPS
ncbi:hypothetical protein D1007_16521 [Hordeum vulgare]|nr:hypothetical protein D1007_16521 [Hordeum vulgare]